MRMDRVLRWLPERNATLESAVAAMAGFLAGQVFHGEWTWAAKILARLFGG
jgi:hypothetical protein